MTDIKALKALIESIKGFDAQEEVDADLYEQAFLQFEAATNPDAVLELIAEIDFLKESRKEAREDRNKYGDKLDAIETECDQLKAGALEDLRLRTVLMEQFNQLEAENETLRKALTDCSDSLHAEMLQKFGGQMPDDMHPVTRREYDRDMAEVAEFRAVLSKGEQS